MGDVESFLALEMVLNSYASSGLCFVSPKTLPYQKPPLGPGLCEKSLGLKELKSPLCIYTLLSTLVSGYSKSSILTTLHTDTHFSIPCHPSKLGWLVGGIVYVRAGGGGGQGLG